MARTMEQNEKMREARKKSIRNAALSQFVRKGLFATRIQDIAEDAGIAQGLLYHYYPSKDAIYVDLIDEALDKTIEASLYVRNMGASAEDKITFALKELLQTIENNDRFAQTSRFIIQSLNSTAIPDEAQRLLDEKRRVPYQVMAEIMEAGQIEGSVVDGPPESLSILFWSTVTGLATYFAPLGYAGNMPDYKIIAAMFLRRKNDD